MGKPKKRLIFAGDSLTEWFDWQARFPGYAIENLGISGETVEGLLSRTGRIITGFPAPDFLFLMTGINNIAMQDYGIISPYRELLRRCQQGWPSTHIVAQSVLPVLLEWIEQWRIPEINAGLKELCRGLDVSYLDVYRSFTDESGVPREDLLMDDGVHLSTKGYEVWSAVVENYIS